MSRPHDDVPDTAPALTVAIEAVTRAHDPAAALQAVVDHACRLAGAGAGTLLALDSQGRASQLFQSGSHGADAPPMSGDGIALVAAGQTYGLLHLAARAEGAPSESQLNAIRALGSVAGYVLDHARSHGAAERRRVWMNHAASLASTLQPPFDFSRADQAVSDSAMRAAGGVAATVARLVDGEVLITASSGSPPLWCTTEEHTTAVHAVLDGSAGEADAGHEHSVLLASMSTHLNPVAVVCVYFPAASPPDDFEMDLLAEFSEQAALALDRAQAFRDRERMALITDRDRIARELHDVVIQRLFATGLHLQKSRNMASDPVVEERLALTMQDLDLTIRSIRSSIFDLQGGPRTSLRSDLRDLVAEFTTELGFTPTVHTEGPIDQALTGSAQRVFVDMLRQGLSNVARHAQARSATVEVHTDADVVVVEVRDDGIGVAPDHRERGLAALRSELALRGGGLELFSNASGATLHCRIPLG